MFVLCMAKNSQQYVSNNTKMLQSLCTPLQPFKSELKDIMTQYIKVDASLTLLPIDLQKTANE